MKAYNLPGLITYFPKVIISTILPIALLAACTNARIPTSVPTTPTPIPGRTAANLIQEIYNTKKPTESVPYNVSGPGTIPDLEGQLYELDKNSTLYTFYRSLIEVARTGDFSKQVCYLNILADYEFFEPIGEDGKKVRIIIKGDETTFTDYGCDGLVDELHDGNSSTEVNVATMPEKDKLELNIIYFDGLQLLLDYLPKSE